MGDNFKPNPVMDKVFANKFRLVLPKISIVSDIFDRYAMNSLELSVRGTVAAGLKVAAQDVPSIAHKPHKLTGAGYSLDDIEVKFLIDGNFVNYYMLWTWLNRIYNLKTGESPVLEDGVSPYENFIIMGMDSYNKPVVKFKYDGGFITSLSEVSVAYDNSDRLEASAMFAYDDYSVEVAPFSS